MIEEEEEEEKLVEMEERLLDGELEDPEGCEDGVEGFGAMAQQRAAALHGPPHAEPLTPLLILPAQSETESE